MSLNLLEVLSASCSAYSKNKGFIKKDQVRFDKNMKVNCLIAIYCMLTFTLLIN